MRVIVKYEPNKAPIIVQDRTITRTVHTIRRDISRSPFFGVAIDSVRFEKKNIKFLRINANFSRIHTDKISFLLV